MWAVVTSGYRPAARVKTGSSACLFVRREGVSPRRVKLPTAATDDIIRLHKGCVSQRQMSVQKEGFGLFFHPLAHVHIRQLIEKRSRSGLRPQ